MNGFYIGLIVGLAPSVWLFFAWDHEKFVKKLHWQSIEHYKSTSEFYRQLAEHYRKAFVASIKGDDFIC